MTPRFLDIALECAQRGWFVFPLVPKSKRPATQRGKDDATRDPAKINDWWGRQNPNFNVGIATGPSGLCVVDADYGLTDPASWLAWCRENGMPSTYAVRSGRRSSFGVQMYYTGSTKDGRFELNGVSGDIKSAGGYVLAAGSIHPETGETYEVVLQVAPAMLPASVLEVARKTRAATSVEETREKVTEGRNNYLTRVAGRLRNSLHSAAAIEAGLMAENEDWCDPPLPEEEVQRIAANAAKWVKPEDAPSVLLGSGKGIPQTGGDDTSFAYGALEGGNAARETRPRPAHWQDYFHNFDDIANAPEPRFIIEDFLEEDGVTALAAPVGQRKTIIALNIAHACCTGEPLFGRFEVKHKPSRVLYLCPEMGLQSFAKRVNAIGLSPHVGKSFFCRTTASTTFDLTLPDLTPEMLDGAVVVVDTMVRFLEGEESSATDMARFAKLVMGLTSNGAKSVVLLVHSLKATKDAQELSLENAIRGSGELGAFLSACWATRLQDPTDEYNTRSYLRCVKQRNFESKPFEVECSRETYRMTLVGEPGRNVSLASAVQRGNKDGMQDAADALIKASPQKSATELSALLKEHGIERSGEWCRKRRRQFQANGVQLTAA